MTMTEGDLRHPLEAQLFDKLIKEPDDVVARIASLFEIRDPNNSLEALRAAIQVGKMPILVSNHQSHADVIPASTITSQLETAFNLPVAASIEGGQQGDFVRDINVLIAPVLARHNLFTLPIVTRRDEEIREMEKAPNADVFRRLSNSGTNGGGFAMFPEASVKGGRTIGSGKINGLIRHPNPEQRDFSRWLRNFVRKGKDPVILPIGIDGSYKIFSPDTNSFSHEVMEMILGLADSRAIATVTLGDLIPFKDVGVPQADSFFMEKIATLLPPIARGAYSLTSK